MEQFFDQGIAPVVEKKSGTDSCVLLDFTHLLFRSFFAEFAGEEFSDDIVRHTALSQILKYRKLFPRDRYPHMVLCWDGPRSWRKEVYPFYKASRLSAKKDKTKAEQALHDKIGQVFDLIRGEMIEEMPYISIFCPGTEADDAIAILAKDCYARGAESVVVSSDKDMKQLTFLDGCRFWDVKDKKFFPRPKDQNAFLIENFCRGDAGDGVPNFLSDDDVFVNPDKRQKSIMAKKVLEWVALGDPSRFCETDEQLRNYHRNVRMIDLLGDAIPVVIHERVREAFEISNAGVMKRKMKMYKYFMAKDLKSHLRDINLF